MHSVMITTFLTTLFIVGTATSPDIFRKFYWNSTLISLHEFKVSMENVHYI